MKEILTENVFNLDLDFKDIRENGVIKYKISNMSELYTAINNIIEFGFIENEFLTLSNYTFFHEKSNSVILEVSLFNTFKTNIELIKSKTIAVIKAISYSLPEQNDQSVSIKLPPIKELTELQNVIKELDQILGQAISAKYPGDITLQNFDTGSNWIEICLENKEALIFLGSFIKSSIDLMKNYYTQWKQTKHMVQILEADQEAKQLIIEALNNTVKSQAQFYASALMRDYKLDEGDHEYHTNLTYSIEKLSGLISKGAEIHTALNAPEEAKVAFPDVVEQKKNLIENNIHLLEDTLTNSDELEDETSIDDV